VFLHEQKKSQPVVVWFIPADVDDVGIGSRENAAEARDKRYSAFFRADSRPAGVASGLSVVGAEAPERIRARSASPQRSEGRQPRSAREDSTTPTEGTAASALM